MKKFTSMGHKVVVIDQTNVAKAKASERVGRQVKRIFTPGTLGDHWAHDHSNYLVAIKVLLRIPFLSFPFSTFFFPFFFFFPLSSSFFLFPSASIALHLSLCIGRIPRVRGGDWGVCCGHEQWPGLAGHHAAWASTDCSGDHPRVSPAQRAVGGKIGCGTCPFMMVVAHLSVALM